VIAGEEDAPLLGREAELIPVRDAPATQLVQAEHVQAEPARHLSRPRLQVLVQEKSRASGSTEDRSPRAVVGIAPLEQ
jgi:hypothetical protein